MVRVFGTIAPHVSPLMECLGRFEGGWRFGWLATDTGCASNMQTPVPARKDTLLTCIPLPHPALQAGVLQYAKQITDAQAGGPIVDAVITVPAWFGIAQRQVRPLARCLLADGLPVVCHSCSFLELPCCG